MARPLPVKRAAAMPLPSREEARLREEGRREALDAADRSLHSTLITLDRRQQAQGEQLLELARLRADDRALLERIDAKIDAFMRDFATPPPIDERAEALAATVPACPPARAVGGGG